jgi:hypothetical protein
MASFAGLQDEVTEGPPKPSDGGWGEKSWYMLCISTACVCTVIIQIFNNPIMYGYFLVLALRP